MLFLTLLHFNIRLTVRLVMMEQDKELVFSVGSSALMREFLERSLSSPNRTVVSFRSLEEGTRATARGAVDLIMYCVDGLKSPSDKRCLELWGERQIPVIVLSAMDGIENKISWLKRGVVDYVVKPFEIEDLSARVDVQMRQIRGYKDLLSANEKLSHEVKKMERLAIVDGLTRLYNHRYFQERLRAEFQRARRYMAPLSLILLDIDDFKDVNDLHGHQVGDAVLAALSRALKQEMRASDLPARYGGEEIAVILPETDRMSARAIAERLRERIEGLRFAGRGNVCFSITASFGVTSLDNKMGSSAELVETADDSLYVAKASGKNRTAVFDR
ncbi:MAG TPA: diguanylate cyclase [bacterium]|nr:diguanylate cyclase [bacterium]